MNKKETSALDLHLLTAANTSLDSQVSDQARRQDGVPLHPNTELAGGDLAMVPLCSILYLSF